MTPVRTTRVASQQTATVAAPATPQLHSTHLPEASELVLDDHFDALLTHVVLVGQVSNLCGSTDTEYRDS